MAIKKGQRVLCQSGRTYIVTDVIEDRVAHIIPDDNPQPTGLAKPLNQLEPYNPRLHALLGRDLTLPQIEQLFGQPVFA